MARSTSTSTISMCGIRRSALLANCRTAIRPFFRRQRASRRRFGSPSDSRRPQMLQFTHNGLRAALVTAALVAASACNSLLSVDNPGRVPDDQLGDPALAPALEAGAIQ